MRVSAVSRIPEQLDVFSTDSAGRVISWWWNAAGEWSDWRSLGGFFPNGAPVTALARYPNHMDLFVTGNDGRVFTSWWHEGQDWSGVHDNWRSIGGFFPNGAPVTAVARTPDHMDLFVTGNDGRVFTSWWHDGQDWSGVNDNWTAIGGFFPNGAPVTALARYPNHMDLFVTGNDGRVFTSWWHEGQDWSGVHDNWRSIGGVFPNGAPVTAVARTPDHMDLFVTGNDGRVFTSWWHDGQDWSGVNDNWTAIGGFFPNGAPVTALARYPNHMDLFVTGNDGRVFTSWWHEGQDWSGVHDNWRSIGGVFPNGAPVTAVARTPDHMDLFVTGNDGRVFTSWWHDGQDWSGVNDNWLPMKDRRDLGPDDFNLTVVVDSIFCFQGDDIDNIVGNESEPYLWVFMIKLDGNGLFQDGNYLAGTPRYFFSPGSHGNIGGSILRGTRRIPPAVGLWNTSMRSIPISVAGQQLGRIPGTLLCGVVLMEENLTPNSAVEAAHASLCDLIRNTVSGTLASLGLAGLAADAAAEVAIDATHGVATSIETAAQRVLERRLQPIRDLFTVAAPANTALTILKNLKIGGFIGSAIDADKPMGVFARTFSQAELAATFDYVWYWNRGTPIEFGAHMAQGSDWAYNMSGRAFAHHTQSRLDPPATNRLQVSCCTRRTLMNGDRRVAGLGGVESGARWWMSRQQVADSILKGQKSFYIMSDTGIATEVKAARAGSYHGESWPDYVYTESDHDVSNNLLALPDCAWGDTVEVWY